MNALDAKIYLRWFTHEGSQFCKAFFHCGRINFVELNHVILKFVIIEDGSFEKFPTNHFIKSLSLRVGSSGNAKGYFMNKPQHHIDQINISSQLGSHVFRVYDGILADYILFRLFCIKGLQRHFHFIKVVIKELVIPTMLYLFRNQLWTSGVVINRDS